MTPDRETEYRLLLSTALMIAEKSNDPVDQSTCDLIKRAAEKRGMELLTELSSRGNKLRVVGGTDQ